MTIALVMMSIMTACLLMLCGALMMMLQEMKVKIKYLKAGMKDNADIKKEVCDTQDSFQNTNKQAIY